jgi:Putative undecaprenyl diphosphate synthase
VQALEWCLELGVPCVSVYAFSLENFNRSAAEVAVLMDLAERKLLAILQVHSARSVRLFVSKSCRLRPNDTNQHQEAVAHKTCAGGLPLLVWQPQLRLPGLGSAHMNLKTLKTLATCRSAASSSGMGCVCKCWATSVGCQTALRRQQSAAWQPHRTTRAAC